MQVAGLLLFRFVSGRAHDPPLARRQVADHDLPEAGGRGQEKKDTRVRSRRARPAAHSGKSNRLQVKWPKNRFTKPTPAELDKAPGKLIHFQGFMKASAPNVLQIMLYRGRGMQWTSN